MFRGRKKSLYVHATYTIFLSQNLKTRDKDVNFRLEDRKKLFYESIVNNDYAERSNSRLVQKYEQFVQFEFVLHVLFENYPFIQSFFDHFSTVPNVYLL